MRKQLFVLTTVTFSILLLSFSTPSATEKKETTKKTFTGIFRSKTAVSSASQTLSVSFTVEAGVGTISAIRIYDASTCQQYSYVGYSGYISYMYIHGGYHYVAYNVNIDLNGTDYVVIGGQLDDGASICEA